MGNRPKMVRRSKVEKVSARPQNNCTHPKGFVFEQTNQGVKRTCRLNCGFSVTEIGRQVNSTKKWVKKQGVWTERE